MNVLGGWLRGELAREAPRFSWREVWLWAARHRCRGLLLRTVTGAPWHTEEDRAHLRHAAFALSTHALAQSAECKRLERHLRNRGVRVLFFKGVALGLELYGDAAARAGGDIDCMVETEAVPEALDCLAELGYEPERHSIAQIRERMERPFGVRK